MIYRLIIYLMVVCVTLLTGANLRDISYSIKQNGIMVNIDYDVPINDDDIIGWKSDRGWVYLTLLGVKSPKNKITTKNFKGDVRKIVVDDFDESTQLAILLKKPILGYDIINSKGSPGTIVFIHTEMKKSEVLSLKEHIKKDGTSVFNTAKSSGFPKYNTNFKKAFDQARQELGPNAIFEYHGKIYTTNHPGEKLDLKQPVLIEETKSDVLSIEQNQKIEELYVEEETGEIIKEIISDTLVKNSNQDSLFVNNEKIKSELLDDDDGWFSGLLPSYKNSKSKNPFRNRKSNEKFEVIKNNSPILVDEKKIQSKWGFWKRLRKNKRINQNRVLQEANIKKEDTVKNNEIKKFVELQNKYIPPKMQNIELNIADNDYSNLPQTQLSDTNDVEISFTLNPEKIGFNRLEDLQKKYIPKPVENIIGDTLSALYYPKSSTQSADTNVIKAWFNSENIISQEYDSRFLQEKYIPIEKHKEYINPSYDSGISESLPQTPEYTAPFILDERFKAQYKNKSRVNRPKREVEQPFEPKREENTWLSYFPLQSDSIRKKLNWDNKKDKEVPKFLQKESESLDYSPDESLQYSWRSELSDKRPSSFPSRYSDPGFRYYRQGGIKVEANLRNVPIYIDGKYVGDTPLNRPIEVEPGWHQVSGFSPVYTHLASQKGLQFVGYDSIIQNNEMYGSTTVYAEAGKLETVSLKFNQMGDVPKKMREINGGMSLGIPMFTLLIGLVTWAM